LRLSIVTSLETTSPEIPDLETYRHALAGRVVGRTLTAIEVVQPFLLRSVSPSPADFHSARVVATHRIGKRLVLACDADRFLVMHLMIAGRLQWSDAGAKPGRMAAVMARFVLDSGTLTLTEAGTTRRASLHLVSGSGALAQFERGGLEPLDITSAEFADRLRSEQHTLKRSLTDPRLFAGIGNAYSDEILFAARLSPLTMSRALADADVDRLFVATQTVLREWTARLSFELRGAWPSVVTAFREDFSVHGRFGLPCRTCSTPIQRIRYASNETNYCARCQTNGRLLADRAMSRLLGKDWPKSIDEVDG
jgi:formamidopyrimidine-DNA glycosylase